MSSTRRATEDAPMSQERYASSSAYEPGLLGNLVAKRCKALRNPEDRALVYWIQQRSHDEGGLTKFAEDFIAAFPDRLGSEAVQRVGKRRGQFYTAAETAIIDKDFDRAYDYADFWETGRVRRFSECAESHFWSEHKCADSGLEAPVLSVDYFLDHCLSKASEVPKLLQQLCLDPKFDFNYSVWWFKDLIGALRLYRERFIESAKTNIAQTTISEQVFEDLDYAAHCRGLVIIEGDQRIGKSTAARSWCEQHPGQAIYVKLGVGNDDATFFRSIARALGTAASLTRKPTEMQMKIEDALQEGHLLLVIDEAHFCFAQTQRPRSAPARIDWIRTALTDFNVGVALISTPQFDRSCEMYERQLQWNARQIKGRVKLHRLLPTELPQADLLAVAGKMAPRADESSLLRLLGFAQSTDAYLAGIERLVCRATFFANRDGRDVASRADIKRAYVEAVECLEIVTPPPAPSPRKRRGSARATALQGPSKPLSDALPLARARRSGPNPPAPEEAGFGASNRLQFTEAAALS